MRDSAAIETTGDDTKALGAKAYNKKIGEDSTSEVNGAPTHAGMILTIELPKDSGTIDENGRTAIDEYTEIKAVGTHVAGDAC